MDATIDASTKSSRPLVVGKPNPTNVDDFIEHVKEILDTGIFTNDGPFVKQLEDKVSSYTGAKYALAVSNATIGIEWTLRALQLIPGGEVILPSFTFIATAHAVVAAGLTPIFCDINRETHLPDVADIERVVSSNTVAILAVNLWGLMCDPSIEKFAKERSIPLVFDSAHSFGALNAYNVRAGNMGRAEVFSLHATKLFNSFEGGLIVTNDDTLASRIVAMRNFGITGQDTVSFIGTNCKLSEIHAAFACSQLARIEETKQLYRRNAEIYAEEFRKRALKGISLWNRDFLQSGCTHAYVCILVDDESPVTRDLFMEKLRDKDIYAKRYFYPGIHKHPCYAKLPLKTDLPNTDWLNEHLLTLPTGRLVMTNDIIRIVQTISNIHASYSSAESIMRRTVDVRIDETMSETRRTLIESKLHLLRSKVREYEVELQMLSDK